MKDEIPSSGPLFYVKGRVIYQRPVKSPPPLRSIALGFAVCEVCGGVDPDEVCRILNMGEKPPEHDP